MVDQEPAARRLVEVHAVVPRGADGLGLFAVLPRQRGELIAAHELHAVGRDVVVVPEVSRLAGAVQHAVALGVLIGAFHVLRAAHAHVVAVVHAQPAEGQEQVVVAGRLVVDHVGRFDAAVVAAQQVDAVGLLALQDQARGRVQLQQEDAAGIGAVDHPQPFLGVEEHAGVDGVGQLRGVVARLAALEQDLHVLKGALRAVRHRQAQRRQGLGALAAAVVHVVAAVRQPNHVRGPEGARLGKGQGLLELAAVVRLEGALVQLGKQLPVLQILRTSPPACGCRRCSTCRRHTAPTDRGRWRCRTSPGPPGPPAPQTTAPAAAAKSRGGAYQPFTAPAVMPSTMNFCANR